MNLFKPSPTGCDIVCMQSSLFTTKLKLRGSYHFTGCSLFLHLQSIHIQTKAHISLKNQHRHFLNKVQAAEYFQTSGEWCLSVYLCFKMCSSSSCHPVGFSWCVFLYRTTSLAPISANDSVR